MVRLNQRDRIEEIHEEVKKESEQNKTGILKNIPPSTLIFFGLALIVTIFFATSKGYDMNQVFFVISLVVALVLMISMNQKRSRLLTEQESKIELYQQLKFKQRNKLGEYKELPEGTIKVAIKGRLRFFQGNPWKRQIGFSIITTEGFELQYSAELDPFSGDIIGVYEGYFDPRDASDLTYLAPPELLAEKKWAEYGGKLR